MNSKIAKAKKGDEEAFREILNHIRNDLYKLAYSYLKNEEDAKDILQETAIDIYNSIKNLKNEEALKQWAEKIVVNKCKQHFNRKNKKEIPTDFKNMESYVEVTNNILETENNLDFNLLISKLDEEERMVVILFYSEKYKIKEIGKILKMNENTVKIKLYRARKKIEKMKEGGDLIGSAR